MSAVSNNFGIQVWEMKRHFPFVAAIPQCRPGAGWTEGELDKALGFLDHVAAEYEADPDRVYVTGVSSGGAGVWNMVASYPERFAAAVPLCGGPAGSAEGLAQAQLQIWNFYNEKDAPDLVEANRRMREKLLEAGASPLATEYPQSSLRDRHNCWDLAYRCTGMYEWLLEQSRSHNARQTQLFELLPADQILSAWQSHGPARWTAEDDRTIACQNAEADQAGYLISGATYAACEFHVDVYLQSPSEECRLGLFNQATDDPLSGYVLHVSPPDTGSGGLCEAQAMAGWRRRSRGAAAAANRLLERCEAALCPRPDHGAHQRLEGARRSHSRTRHAPGAHSVGHSHCSIGCLLAKHTSA